MDQRREGSDQVDAAVVPFLCCQHVSPAASCPGLEPRQLHANPGDARASGAVIPDEFAGEADQDLRRGGQPRPLRHVPDGRGSGAAADVQRDPDADRPAAGAAFTGLKGVLGRKALTKMGELRLDEGKITRVQRRQAG